MTPLESAIAHLEESIAAIYAAGSVAQKGSRIEISAHSTSGVLYARVVVGNRRKGCGQAGSQTHKEARASIERREAIDQLSEILAMLKANRDSPAWNPVSEPEAR
ncbi:MAG: hypothetical protein WA947_17855 [Phormidesmis sp.]